MHENRDCSTVAGRANAVAGVIVCACNCFMMNYTIDVLLHGQKLRVIKVIVLTGNLSYMGYGTRMIGFKL